MKPQNWKPEHVHSKMYFKFEVHSASVDVSGERSCNFKLTNLHSLNGLLTQSKFLTESISYSDEIIQSNVDFCTDSGFKCVSLKMEFVIRFGTSNGHIELRRLQTNFPECRQGERLVSPKPNPKKLRLRRAPHSRVS